MPLHTQYVRTYTIAQLNVEKVGRGGEKEADFSLPRSHPPSPNLYTKPCSVRRPTTYNTTTTHPSLCHAKEKGKGGGGTYVQRNGGSRGATTYCTAAKEDSQPCFYCSLRSVGRTVGTLFPPLGVPFPTPFHPRCCSLFCSFGGGGGGKAFRRPSPSSSVHGTTHSPPSPSFPTGLLHSTRHPSFLFPLLPSFLARRAKKETLSCSSSGGGELPTNPLLPKRAPSPPQQAPRNRTADGVCEPCSRMYSMALPPCAQCIVVAGVGKRGREGGQKAKALSPPYNVCSMNSGLLLHLLPFLLSFSPPPPPPHTCCHNKYRRINRMSKKQPRSAHSSSTPFDTHFPPPLSPFSNRDLLHSFDFLFWWFTVHLEKKGHALKVDGGGGGGA